jgi:hypothetical protein
MDLLNNIVSIMFIIKIYLKKKFTKILKISDIFYIMLHIIIIPITIYIYRKYESLKSLIVLKIQKLIY